MVGREKNWMRNARGTVLSVLLLAATAATAGEVSIPFANSGGIHDWRADGAQGMWIEEAGGRWFYAGFSSQCPTLRSAMGVKFVPEPSGTLSRWSSIRLQHDQRCFFRTLQPSNAPPDKAAPRKPATESNTPAKVT